MPNKYYGKAFFVEDTLTPGLKTFFGKVDPEARKKGLIAMALQLLNNTVNGSPGSSAKPPIREGRLRGSGSIFVGSESVGDSLFWGKDGTPALSQSISTDPDTVLIGFNTPYAARMHEHMIRGGTPDPWLNILFIPHRDAEVVEAKFLEKHLKEDTDEIFGVYTRTYRKFAGT